MSGSLKEKRPDVDRGKRSVTVAQSVLKTDDVMRVAEELLAQIAKEAEKEKKEQAEGRQKEAYSCCGRRQRRT